MFLFVMADGTTKQVTENPSVLDILALQQGLLSIYRFCRHFQKLMVCREKLYWVNVPDAKILQTADARVHA